MADEFDRASEYEQIARDEAIARTLAAAPPFNPQRNCEHCEEFPRAQGSVNCVRCVEELAH